MKGLTDFIFLLETVLVQVLVQVLLVVVQVLASTCRALLALSELLVKTKKTPTPVASSRAPPFHSTTTCREKSKSTHYPGTVLVLYYYVDTCIYFLNDTRPSCSSSSSSRAIYSF